MSAPRIWGGGWLDSRQLLPCNIYFSPSAFDIPLTDPDPPSRKLRGSEVSPSPPRLGVSPPSAVGGSSCRLFPHRPEQRSAVVVQHRGQRRPGGAVTGAAGREQSGEEMSDPGKQRTGDCAPEPPVPTAGLGLHGTGGKSPPGKVWDREWRWGCLKDTAHPGEPQQPSKGHPAKP